MKQHIMTVALILAAAICGYFYGSQVTTCQRIVVDDIKAHQQFSAQLSKLVDGDFLTQLTEGKK